MVVMGGSHGGGTVPVGEGASRRASAANTKERAPGELPARRGGAQPPFIPVSATVGLGHGLLAGAQRSAWRHCECLNTLWCTSYGKCSHSVVVAGEDSPVSFGTA